MVLAAIDNNAANQQAFLDHVNSVGTCRRGVCGRRTMGKLSAAWPLCTIPTLKVDNAEDWTDFNTPTVRTCWFSGFLILLLCAFCVCSNSCWILVDVFLSLAFVTLFDCHVKSSLSTLMCVGLSARGSVWKMLKVRGGHVLWSCGWRIARLILHQLLSRFGAGTGHQYWILCIGHFGRSCHCGTKV